MNRTITGRSKATALLALACSTALVLAVANVQARPALAAGANAATARAASQCTIVVSGAHWSVRAGVPGGILAGDRYTLKARDMPCSSARTWVVKLTKQKGTGQIEGPQGFRCVSFSTAASGDKLLYSGACMRPPHNHPFFEWGPKVRQS